MALTRLIRAVVSKDSKRFVEGDYDLNLSYITPRLLAMGFPAEGVETVFRNSLADVASFLASRHAGRYMVWNLSGRPYDYALLHDQVLDYGFPDHHNPPLHLLLKVVHSLHAWLHADASHVAVVHCLAGKGRTGTVLACYLLYAGLARSSSHALALYACRRSHVLKGVARPSQRRYVAYFRSLLSSPAPLARLAAPALLLHHVSFTGLPAFVAAPLLHVAGTTCTPPGPDPFRVKEVLLYSSAASHHPVEVDVGEVRMEVGVVVQGDVVVRLFHVTSLLAREVLVLRTSLHTAFVSPCTRLPCCQVDLADTDRRFPPSFSMQLHFAPAAPSHVEDEWEDEAYLRFFAEGEALREANRDAVLAFPPGYTEEDEARDAEVQAGMQETWQQLQQAREAHAGGAEATSDSPPDQNAVPVKDMGQEMGLDGSAAAGTEVAEQGRGEREEAEVKEGGDAGGALSPSPPPSPSPSPDAPPGSSEETATTESPLAQ